MLRKVLVIGSMLLAVLSSAAPVICAAQTGKGADSLVGAWRGKVQFTSGVFAETKDLEFMYTFHLGGTMTESSNYDAVPPVPPAYGIWRKVGDRKYEAKYHFFQSKAMTTSEELFKTGGWGPDGQGVLVQKVSLSVDGTTFDSRITLQLFDKDGKPVEGGGEGTATAERIRF